MLKILIDKFRELFKITVSKAQCTRTYYQNASGLKREGFSLKVNKEKKSVPLTYNPIANSG